MQLTLRIKEQTPLDKVPMEFYFIVENALQGYKWLMDNGFQKLPRDASSLADSWTREGGRTSIIFLKGLNSDSAKVIAGIDHPLKADFLPVLNFVDVKCEDATKALA